MRKITNLLFTGLALMLVVGMSSCSKEKTTKNKITGTWDLDKTMYKYTSDGEVIDQGTEQAQAGDQVTFNEDGTYEVNIDGSKENGTYTIEGDDKIIIDDETLEIQELTNSALILYGKDVEDADVYESWLYFSK